MRDPDGARMRAILAFAAAIAFILFSYLAPDFDGYHAEQMPQGESDPAVQPAGFAFGIWGVIYLWLLISTGFGLLQRAEAPDWDRHRWPLIGAMVLGAGWIWVAVQSPILATVVIWAMLGLALWALAQTPVRDFWLARGPVGLFAGWLTAASFVSLGVVLAGYGVFGSTRIAALVFVPLTAAFAVAVCLRLRPGGAYALAAGWGLFGIAVDNLGRNLDVAVLAVIGLLVVAAVWWRGRTAPA